MMPIAVGKVARPTSAGRARAPYRKAASKPIPNWHSSEEDEIPDREEAVAIEHRSVARPPQLDQDEGGERGHAQQTGDRDPADR
jgi:hypothetical protein